MNLFRDQPPAPTSADQHHPCGCMVAVVDLLGHRIGCPATLPAPAIVDLVTHVRVTFDRIGRSQGAPAPLDIPSSDPDEIAETVYRYARQRLASHDVEAHVDMDELTVHVLVGGFRCVGRGEIEHTSPEVWL